MIVNEIQRVGNHSQSTTERFSQSRCQNEVFQHLHSTNISCIQRENVTIVIVMDNNSNCDNRISRQYYNILFFSRR